MTGSRTAVALLCGGLLAASVALSSVAHADSAPLAGLQVVIDQTTSRSSVSTPGYCQAASREVIADNGSPTITALQSSGGGWIAGDSAYLQVERQGASGAVLHVAGNLRATNGAASGSVSYESATSASTSCPGVVVAVGASVTLPIAWHLDAESTTRCATGILRRSSANVYSLELTLTAKTVPSAAACAAACPEVFYIAARGSGEPSGFGKELESVRSTLAKGLQGRSFEAIAVSYPAESVNIMYPTAREVSVYRHTGVVPVTWLLRIRRFLGSVDAGATATYSAIVNRTHGCATTSRLLLAGYSQGAMGVHRALLRLAAARLDILKHISAVLLLADGDRVRGSKAKIVGRPAAGIGGSGVGDFTHTGPRKDVPAVIAGRTINVCDKSDFVCDTNARHAPSGFKVHTSYLATPELAEGVRYLLARAG